jgi:HK97 family phage prohead protease
MSTQTIVFDHTNATTTSTATPQRAFLVREFAATDLEVVGRTVDVRLVPFGEVAEVSDFGGPAYREEWMPGVFDHQVNAAFRIEARYGHSPHVIDVVGHGRELRRESDGYHVSTTIHPTPQGDTTLELLHARVLTAVSLEAQSKPSGTRRTADGVVQRIKANLTGFAFCRRGAFAGAQVLAIRENEEIIDEELLPVDIDPDVVERLRRHGIALPDRYQAHPAEDTPAEVGTSETAPASETIPTRRTSA